MSQVLSDQFANLMNGDRFFYLWDDDLSQDDLDFISNSRLSDVILRNTGIENLRGNVFFVPEPSGLVMALLAIAFVARRRGR